MPAEVDQPSSDETAVADNKARNETLATELNFELLRQYAWLSSAAIGAIVVLMQMDVIASAPDTYISILLISVSTFCAIMAQDHIVDSLLKGKNVYQIGKSLQRFRMVSMLFMGAGVGSLFANQFLF